MKAAPPPMLSPLLAELFKAFDSDDPGAVTPVLSKLETILPPAALAPIHEAVDNFDFRGGEEVVRALAAEYNISVEASI